MAKKMYLVNNSPNNILIRNAFHKALTAENFIEDLNGQTNTLIVERQQNTIIQSLNIDGLDDESIKAIWRVNLEKEILGISSKNLAKTPEIALLILTHKDGHSTSILNIIFFELKSSLEDKKLISGGSWKQSTLQQCEDKLKAAINRLYMLLTLNEHKNDSDYNNSAIIVKFIGVICYKQDRTSMDDNTYLYKILKRLTTENLTTYKTILSDQDKIAILFFQNQNNINISQLGII